jgi:hypothetical protein
MARLKISMISSSSKSAGRSRPIAEVWITIAHSSKDASIFKFLLNGVLEAFMKTTSAETVFSKSSLLERSMSTLFFPEVFDRA